MLAYLLGTLLLRRYSGALATGYLSWRFEGEDYMRVIVRG